MPLYAVEPTGGMPISDLRLLQGAEHPRDCQNKVGRISGPERGVTASVVAVELIQRATIFLYQLTSISVKLLWG